MVAPTPNSTFPSVGINEINRINQSKQPLRDLAKLIARYSKHYTVLLEARKNSHGKPQLFFEGNEVQELANLAQQMLKQPRLSKLGFFNATAQEVEGALNKIRSGKSTNLYKLRYFDEKELDRLLSQIAKLRSEAESLEEEVDETSLPHRAIDRYREILIVCAAQFPAPQVLRQLAYAQFRLGMKEAEDTLKRAFKFYPSDAGVLSDLGLFYRNAERYEKAIIYFEKALGAGEISPLALVELGECYGQTQDYFKAIQCLEEAIHAGVADASVKASLAKCYFNMERYRLAEFTIAEAENDPSIIEALVMIARHLVYKDKTRSPKPYLDRILEIEPLHPRGHFLLALYYMDTDNHKNAIVSLTIVLKDEPNHLKAQRKLIQCHIRAKEFDKALPILNQFLRQCPKEMWAILEKAECLRRLKRYEEAIPIYEKVLHDSSLVSLSNQGTKEKYFIKALSGLGQCYIKSGKRQGADAKKAQKFQQAINYFTRLIKDYPNLNSRQRNKAYEGLATAHEAMAETSYAPDIRPQHLKKAHHYLDKILEHDPFNEEILQRRNDVVDALKRYFQKSGEQPRE